MRILCLLALIALSAAEQVVKTKDWRTTEVSIDSKSFTKIVDAEGRETSFYIKRLAPSKEDWVHDCYEVRLDNTGSASDYKFCYPSLHIAGMAQCGTSSLFQFFAQHEPIAAHLGKEHCPSTGLYDYFKSMAHAFEGMFAQKNVMAIGCINPDMLMLIHRLIAPKAVYVFSIRDLPQQRWSAYNFRCDIYTDKDCTGVHDDRAGQGMYRSPGMFDEMLKSENFPDQHLLRLDYSCQSLNTLYHRSFSPLQQYLQPSQLVVISLDQISSPHPEPTLRRLEASMQWLGRNVTLDQKHLPVNTRHEANKTQKHTEGLYPISHNQPMLQSSKDYIYQCWNECGRISQLTGFKYNCSTTMYTTTSDEEAISSHFVKTVSEKDNDHMHHKVMKSLRGK